MTAEERGKPCPMCGGHRAPGTATFAADLGFGVVLVRNVPAIVCEQCGEQWLGDSVAAEIEAIVSDVRDKRQQVAVVAM